MSISRPLPSKKQGTSIMATPTYPSPRSSRSFAPPPTPAPGQLGSIPAESAPSENGSRLRWNIAQTPIFPDPATLPSVNVRSPASPGPQRFTRAVKPQLDLPPVPTPSTSQIVQRRARDETPGQDITPQENETGLPDALKAGVESLSGMSLDDVNVHYNSAKPAPLQALAYTQGTEIHVAPGQEKHLPHELWHVVQQKQGRVKPTLQAHGVAINTDPSLEAEAKRFRTQITHPTQSFHDLRRMMSPISQQNLSITGTNANAPVQRVKGLRVGQQVTVRTASGAERSGVIYGIYSSGSIYTIQTDQKQRIKIPEQDVHPIGEKVPSGQSVKPRPNNPTTQEVGESSQISKTVSSEELPSSFTASDNLTTQEVGESSQISETVPSEELPSSFTTSDNPTTQDIGASSQISETVPSEAATQQALSGNFYRVVPVRRLKRHQNDEHIIQSHLYEKGKGDISKSVEKAKNIGVSIKNMRRLLSEETLNPKDQQIKKELRQRLLKHQSSSQNSPFISGTPEITKSQKTTFANKDDPILAFKTPDKSTIVNPMGSVEAEILALHYLSSESLLGVVSFQYGLDMPILVSVEEFFKNPEKHYPAQLFSRIRNQ